MPANGKERVGLSTRVRHALFHYRVKPNDRNHPVVEQLVHDVHWVAQFLRCVCQASLPSIGFHTISPCQSSRKEKIMPFFRPTSSPAQTSLLYITIGCLTLVWTCVWYFYLLNHMPATGTVFYWVSGFGLTGLTLVLIGLAVGHIGRSARHAEASPVDVVPPAPEANHVASDVVATPPAVPAPVQMNGFPVATPVQPRTNVVRNSS
jgi:hypothetical protein